MSVHLSGLWLPSPKITTTRFIHCKTSSTTKLSPPKTPLSAAAPTIQIVGGGKTPLWRENEDVNDGAVENEMDWAEMDADLNYWTRQLRPVQVYAAAAPPLVLCLFYLFFMIVILLIILFY